MKNLLVIIMVATLLLVPFYGCAYDNKVVLDYEGKPGIWFDAATSDKMLKDLTELSLLREKKIPTLEADIELHKKSIEIYALELTVTEQISMKYEQALDKSEKQREKDYEAYQKQLDKDDKWYKSKTLVFVLGIISGGLLAVGLSFGLNQGVK